MNARRLERRRSALMQARPAVARFTVGEPSGRSLPSVPPLADVQVYVLAFSALNEAFDVGVVVRVGPSATSSRAVRPPPSARGTVARHIGRRDRNEVMNHAGAVVRPRGG